MSKNSKKNSKEAPEQATLDATTPDAEEFIPPPPSDDPELNPEPAPKQETIVENVETKREKAKPGPRPKGFIDDEPTILDRLSALDSWEGVWAYVYRIQPYSNRLIGGNRKIHVRRYDAAFDVQTLMEEAGSGVYQIHATRLVPTTGKRPMFDSGEIRILNQNYPPKIPPGEWVDDPRNKEWAWAKQAIFANEQKKEEPAPKSDPLVDILRDQIAAQRQEMSELRAAMNAKDPSEQTLLAAMAQRLMQPPPPPPDPMASLAAAVQLLKTMQTPPAEPKESPLEKLAVQLLTEKLTKEPASDLDRFFDLKKKWDEANPPARAGKKDALDHVAEIVEAAAPMVAPFMAPLGHALAIKMTGMPQQPTPPMPPQQPQMPPQQIATPSPQPPTPAAPRPQAVPDKPTVAAFSRAVLEHLQKDWSGLDLGDWYLKKYGPQEFEDIRRQGKEEVIAMLKSEAASWAPLEPFHNRAKLDPLIEEFLDWEPEAPEQSATAAAPAAAATPTNNPWANPAPVGVEIQQQ